MLLDLALIICKTKTQLLKMVFPYLTYSRNGVYAEKQYSLIMRQLKYELHLSIPIKVVFLLKYILAGQLKNFLQQNIKHKSHT